MEGPLPALVAAVLVSFSAATEVIGPPLLVAHPVEVILAWAIDRRNVAVDAVQTGERNDAHE